MIRSFGNELAGELFDDATSEESRRLPPGLRSTARMKLLMLHDAGELADLRNPPRDQTGLYSIPLGGQWRLTFLWKKTDAYGVSLEGASNQ